MKKTIYRVWIGDEYETFMSVYFDTREEAERYQVDLLERGYNGDGADGAHVDEVNLFTSYEEAKPHLW